MIIDPLILISFALPIAAFLAVLAWKDPLLFFGIHVSSRAILDGLSEITYKSVFLNMSIMQIYSICLILFLGIYLYIKKNNFNKIMPPALPILLICLSYLLSGIISNDWLPIFENITKWIYMILLSGLIVLILNNYKLNYLMLVLWASVIPAVLIQLYAILTNNYAIATGGHFAYFGGYQHQFMLSYLLLAFTSTSLFLFIYYKNFLIKLFFILSMSYGFVAIYLCGYRTSYLALITFFLLTFTFYIIKSNLPKKIIAAYFFPLIIIFVLYIVGSDLAHKLNDVWIFLRSPLTYLDFSGQEKYIEMFSGRIYIINILMSSYLSSSILTIMLGMGVGSSELIIGTYSHNEFLSALVETGIFGFTAFIFFLAFYLITILKNFTYTKNLEDCVIIGLGIGLLVMTLATMPFRCMRAMILFGVILGVMHYKNNTQKDRILTP
jgi:hypothetical protein